MAIPLPSFQREVTIVNHSKFVVALVLDAQNGKRRREVTLGQGGSIRFVYFRGDNDQIQEIPVSVTVTIQNKRRFEQQLSLPVTGNTPRLEITDEWLEGKGVQ